MKLQHLTGPLLALAMSTGALAGVPGGASDLANELELLLLSFPEGIRSVESEVSFGVIENYTDFATDPAELGSVTSVENELRLGMLRAALRSAGTLT